MERIHDDSTYYARRMSRKWYEGVCPASEIDARMARDYAEADAAERAHDSARQNAAVTDIDGACDEYLTHLRRVAEKSHKLFTAGSAQERAEAAHDLRVEMEQ